MSTETRQKLVDDPRLVLSSESQRDDLLDPATTDTWLVEFLCRLIETCPRPILVTALVTDHDPGTYHEPGRAVDCWNADWEEEGDAAVVDVMTAAARIGATGSPTLVEVGLSGNAAYLESYVTWPEGCDVFIESYADDNEHLHFAVGTPLA